MTRTILSSEEIKHENNSKERIRDLLYLKDNKAILLALENSGSIGILTKKDSE